MTAEPLLLVLDRATAVEIRTALLAYAHHIRRHGGRTVEVDRLAAALGRVHAGLAPVPTRTAPSRPWLSMDEAADLLGVSTRTVQRWTGSGQLDSRKVGGRRLIPRDAIRRHPTTGTDSPLAPAVPTGHGAPTDQEPSR